MATTYFVSEHIDVVMCNDFLRALDLHVKGMSAFHLETPPKNSRYYKCIGGEHQLATAAGTLPARGRFLNASYNNSVKFR